MEPYPALCRSAATWAHHTMSDRESSAGGPPPSRAGAANTREKRKASSVESSSDEFDDQGSSDDGLYEPRPKLPWTHVSTTLSWTDADVVMRS